VHRLLGGGSKGYRGTSLIRNTHPLRITTDSVA
jgi:hypothetical protein